MRHYAAPVQLKHQLARVRITDSTRRETRRRFLRQLGAMSLVSAGIPRYVDARQKTVDSDVVFFKPEDPDYSIHRQPFNKRIALEPAVIAVCLNELGVQAAVDYAKTRRLPIAVKSGGHSLEGYSLNHGGLVVDLSRMNNLQLNADHSFAAGPGCRLAGLFDYLLPQRRLIPTGSCGGVGIAGLTLGGGYGMFSRKHGLTCDHLRRVRLIDGRGQIQDSREHPELLWACRGGGNGNFGIVTRFEFDTVEAPEFFYSYRFKYRNLSANKAAALAEDWFVLARKLPRESFSAFVLGAKTLTILVTDFGPNPKPSSLTSVIATLGREASEVAPVHRDVPINAVKRYYGRAQPLYFKNVSAGFYRDFDDLRKVAFEIFERVMAQPGMLFQINTFDPAAVAQTARGESAFAHRAYAFIGELQSYWDRPSQEQTSVAAVQAIQRLLTRNGIRAHYVNYPDVDLDNWSEAYYGRDNYRRLQQIKQTYDPENRIRHPQSVRLPV